MNKRLPIISLGLCILTWALTIFLFFFLNNAPEKSGTFYFSLGYTLFLELLFFFYIGFLKTSKPTMTKAAFAPVYGIINITYILTGGALLLVWNLFLTDMVSLRIFIAVLILLTAVFIIVGGLVAKSQVHHQESMATEKANATNVVDVQTGFAKAEMRFASVMKQKGLTYKTESSYANGLDNLLNQLKFLPANALTNPSVNRELQDLLQKLNGWIDSITAAELTQEQFDQRFPVFLQETRTILDHLIKSTRK